MSVISPASRPITYHHIPIIVFQTSPSNENFKTYANPENLDEADIKNSDVVENVQNLILVDDESTTGLPNLEETIDSDLDISTQEMSEILDRNSCTEVISPLHLQRNKSQSISSIGSFCSVSSNLSFQEKSKRSGSQISLGSLNNTEKAPAATTTITVDSQLTDQVRLLDHPLYLAYAQNW